MEQPSAETEWKMFELEQNKLEDFWAQPVSFEQHLSYSIFEPSKLEQKSLEHSKIPSKHFFKSKFWESFFFWADLKCLAIIIPILQDSHHIFA